MHFLNVLTVDKMCPVPSSQCTIAVPSRMAKIFLDRSALDKHGHLVQHLQYDSLKVTGSPDSSDQRVHLA